MRTRAFVAAWAVPATGLISVATGATAETTGRLARSGSSYRRTATAATGKDAVAGVAPATRHRRGEELWFRLRGGTARSSPGAAPGLLPRLDQWPDGQRRGRWERRGDSGAGRRADRAARARDGPWRRGRVRDRPARHRLVEVDLSASFGHPATTPLAECPLDTGLADRTGHAVWVCRDAHRTTTTSTGSLPVREATGSSAPAGSRAAAGSSGAVYSPDLAM